MWIVKASAQRPELVQMFEVAFSRRMCCSRVERVRTKPRLPSASTVSPHSRPGICRDIFARGEQADVGAAEIQRIADRLALADDDVGAHLAGRLHQAERHGLGEHGDQQRAVGVAGLGDRREVAQVAEHVRLLDDDAGRVASIASTMSSLACTAGGSARPRRRPCRTACARPRRSADAGRPRAPPCAAASPDAPSAPLRRSRSSRRTSRRWPHPSPVRRATWVWNSKSTCSVPCAISGR